MVLRQAYLWVAKRAAILVGRYSHAHHCKRARRAPKFRNTRLQPRRAESRDDGALFGPRQFLKTIQAPSVDSSRRQMSFAALWSAAGIRI